MSSTHLIFLGTYTRNTSSRGIYAVRLDAATGALGTPSLVAEATDPSWLALSPGGKYLYSVHPSVGQAIGFSVDAAGSRLTPLPAGPQESAQPPSHLAVDATGQVLIAANYRSGYVATMRIRSDGTLAPAHIVPHTGRSIHPTRQQEPHPHSITPSPDNRHVIVADLGVDKIFSYSLDPVAAQLAPAQPPFVTAEPGTGPRHFKFGANGRHAYAINELANTITSYDYDNATGALSQTKVVSTLPPDFAGTSTTAEIRVHPNGRHVYGSNRGHDSIAVFALDAATGMPGNFPLEIVATGGKNPRNFSLSPDGKWLVCGHQDSELLTVYRVDAVTGRLTRTDSTAKVSACVCVLFHG